MRLCEKINVACLAQSKDNTYIYYYCHYYYFIQKESIVVKRTDLEPELDSNTKTAT